MTKRKKNNFLDNYTKIKIFRDMQHSDLHICSKAQELIFSHLDIQAVRLITSSSNYGYSDRYVIITLSLPILLSKTLKCNNTVWTYFNSSACLLYTVNKKFLVLCNGLPAYIKLWSKNVWQSLHANTDDKKKQPKRHTKKKNYVSNCGATVVHT